MESMHVQLGVCKAFKVDFYKGQPLNLSGKAQDSSITMTHIDSACNDKVHMDRQPYEQLSYFIRRPEMIRVLQRKGISYFFPIQYETFDAISYGSDLIGKDRTGSGKTIAYSLPILERLRDQQLLNRPRAKPKFLVVLPTRELAIQVKNEVESLKMNQGEYNVVAVYGGSPMGAQREAINRGADIIAATPGRLIDLLERDAIDLTELQTICLDEADEMLKQGFQEDVERILKIISQRSTFKTQKLLFSATVPKWVEELASNFMSKTRKFIDLIKKYEIKTSRTIEHLSLCLGRNKRTLSETIRNLIGIYAGNHGSVIIFCETKRQANDLNITLQLPQAKSALHGDVPQCNREVIFHDFKQGILKCLIATNVAARGLDIPSVDLIIQMSPPKKADEYVHRAGRTGRAGKNGVCVTIYNRSQSYLMNQIEKVALIRFRNIGQPRQIDILKAKSQEIVTRIKSIDEGVAEYFEDIAKQLIAEKGAEKALALAIAEMSGMRTRIQEVSMQTNSPGFMSYIFSTEAERVDKKDLQEFLSNRVQRFSIEDLSHINYLSDRALAFDVPQGYRKRLQEVILQLEKKESILENSYRLRLVTNEEMLKNFEENQVDFDPEQYQNAIHNQQNLEVCVRGFGYDTDEDILIRFFKNNGVRALQVKMPRDAEGNCQGYAFVLCLTQSEKQKALSLSRQLTIQNRTISIEIPKPRR